MNKKKIVMSIILVIFLSGIVVAVSLINKSVKTDTSSTSTKKTASDIIDITDNYFIEQTNDVYVNLNDYIGKKIRMQGLVYSYENDDGRTCYAVIRNTPGCCGNDGLAGLNIRYEGEYPVEDTWVEVVGTIDTDFVLGQKVPVIKVESIEEKERGKTFISY